MNQTETRLVIRHIRELAAGNALHRSADRDLLQMFIERHDAAAFETLVRRHGPLVLGVCRRMLRNWHDAEDAFQATFWVLARKAGTVTKHDSLSSWLYRVAYHAALKTKAHRSSHSTQEVADETSNRPDLLDEVSAKELIGILDEELQSLSGRYRAPLVLCYLEGKTRDEAAQHLGWSLGTLKRRLEQGRDLLRARLTRRGLTLSAVMLANGLSEGAAGASVPCNLIAGAANLALTIAAGQSLGGAGAAGLIAKGVLQSLFAAKAKIVAASIAVLVLTALSLGWLAHQFIAQRGSEAHAEPVATSATRVPVRKTLFQSNSPKSKAVSSQTKSMTVVGKVINSAGKPVSGARVSLVGWLQETVAGGNLNSASPVIMAQSQSDAQGKFRLVGSTSAAKPWHTVFVLARGKGFCLGFQKLNAAATNAATTLKLLKETPMTGKLVDLQGVPIKGVRVQVTAVGFSNNGQYEGIPIGKPNGKLHEWPEASPSDDKGQFVLRGLNQGQGFGVQVQDSRFAPQSLYFQPGQKKVLSLALAPAQVIEGTVVYGDNGQTVSKARLTVYSSLEELGSYHGMSGQADANGRFHLNPHPGKRFIVSAFAPAGQPYLTLQKKFIWTAGAIKHQLKIALPRGILVKGRITDKKTGRPVSQASIQFIPRSINNPFVRDDVLTGWQAIVVSRPDGVFQIPVLPGPGHLLISGPTQEYIHQVIGSNVLYSGKPGGRRQYPDAIVKLELPAKLKQHDVHVMLQKGVTLRGKVIGTDGKPVSRGLMMCRLNISNLTQTWRFPVEISDGQFELPGVDPRKTYAVYFLDPKRKLAKAVNLSGKEANKPIRVQLGNCGQAKARFVNSQGEPVSDYRPTIEMLVTPGASKYDLTTNKKDELSADSEFLANLDRENYWKGPATDKKGLITFPALIPGATYRIVILNGAGGLTSRDFTVPEGKTKDLGDFQIKQQQ